MIKKTTKKQARSTVTCVATNKEPQFCWSMSVAFVVRSYTFFKELAWVLLEFTRTKR